MTQRGEPYANNVPQGQNYSPYQGRQGLGRHGEYQYQKNYQMTEEEKRVLLECRSESFWYRALPLAMGAGLLTQTLITRGTLTTSTRFGSLPKVGFACFLGYIAGKISYVNTCKGKFLKLENSPIGEMLRKGGGMPPGQAGNFGLPGFQSSSEDPEPSTTAGAVARESYSSFGSPDDYRADMDIDTSNVKTMDSHFDFELTNEVASELEAKRPEMTKTYEDLRRENRRQHASQYTQVLPGHYQPRQAPHAQDSKAPAREEGLPFSSKPSRKPMKNKYGDEME